MRNHDTIAGTTALEMTMRDVLEGMSELANTLALCASGAEFAILGVEPPEGEQRRQAFPSPSEPRRLTLVSGLRRVA